MSQTAIPFTDEDRQRVRSQADRMLEHLGRGAATASELVENIGHRFASSIHVLRQRGYVISTQKNGNGEYVYSLGQRVLMVEVTDEMKAAYYQTEHWKAKRRERREFDEHRCCHCRSTQSLEVHHWNYDLFQEDLSDLATLCSVCHERIHNNANIRIHFPKTVLPEIAAMLI
jgi:5-methylcytosine-specific restriction endonuclease McrA